MENKLKVILRNIAYAILFTVLSYPAFAQKLAAVQEGSVWAPANTKIDAKLNEWDNNFQAFNKTTNIYYTMANDGTNLYLVMKSANQANNNKIIGGGVTLTINTDGRKKDNVKDAFVIEFPVINYENLRTQMMSFRGGAGGPPDSAAIVNMRKKAVSAFKEVKLFGFKDISDSVISVYNEYGIKAFVDFDDKGSLAIEMAVPLKYLQITAGVPIAYNIKLNGINLNKIMPGMMAAGGPGGGAFAGGGGGNFGGGGGRAVTVVTGSPVGGGQGMGGGMGMPRGMDDMMSMLSPTDFWGKYALAKKQ